MAPHCRGVLGTAAPCVGCSLGEPLLLPANLGWALGHVCSPRARPRVPKARGDLVPAQSSRRRWWQGRARCQPAASLTHVSPRCPRLDFVPAPPCPPPPLRMHEAGRGETQGWGGKCLCWRDAASRDPASRQEPGRHAKSQAKHARRKGASAAGPAHEPQSLWGGVRGCCGNRRGPALCLAAPHSLLHPRLQPVPGHCLAQGRTGDGNGTGGVLHACGSALSPGVLENS